MNQTLLEFYATHSRFSDPGPYAELYATLPQGIPSLSQAILGLIVHYRASGIPFSQERLAEIDARWIAEMLERIVAHNPAPLHYSRPAQEHHLGCCRDHSLMLVSVLRGRGIPARTRVGFAPYILTDFNLDHVIAEYWNGGRWVSVDPEMSPDYVPFDPYDMPEGSFLSASRVWKMIRDGSADPNLYGVYKASEYMGDWFVRNYVFGELAHLNKHELLLWDLWGAVSTIPDSHFELADHVADLLLQGDVAFEAWLEAFEHPDLKVPEAVLCFSPTGNVRKALLSAAR